MPHQVDAAFYDAFRRSGVLAELSDALLDVLVEMVGAKDEDTRRLDLLALYYGASGDPDIARRRARADRMILHDSGLPENAHAIVARLGLANPELRGLRLERIGADDGPLVLRCGDHVSAVADDDEDDGTTVSVRSIVQSVNVLLDRYDVPVRLLALRGDGLREMYVALGVSEALQLCAAGHLDETSVNQVLEFGAW